MSSGGVADYIWSRLAEPGEALLDVGRRRYEREDTPFSYRNCQVVQCGDDVVGMLVAFPTESGDEPRGEPDEPGAGDAGGSGEPEDPVLAPYAALEDPGSYYVCGVALFPEYRGRGIGSRLMALAEQDAAALGLNRTSLVVFRENAGALRLYQRLGYAEIARARVVPHPLIRVTGDALLMVKQLPEPGLST
jgi:ribosomal protein S18 acetylase RimI-like enzyme